jgi:hypothetical protein
MALRDWYESAQSIVNLSLRPALRFPQFDIRIESFYEIGFLPPPPRRPTSRCLIESRLIVWRSDRQMQRKNTLSDPINL